MNVHTIHPEDQSLSTIKLFNSEAATATSIQILKGGKSPQHKTSIPALLVCVSGEAHFENEHQFNRRMKSGDFIEIEPQVVHWVEAIEDSQLVLIR